MNQPTLENEAIKISSAMDAEIRSLPIRNTATLRAVRRKFSRTLLDTPSELVFQLARHLCKDDNTRWLAYELIHDHPAAFTHLDSVDLEELGRGINSWWTVDAFARTLSGPAWLNRQVPDQLIDTWARSGDRWWRRAALVSTVALNVRSQGGRGDVPRTLRVCRLLAGDQDDMVAKALSWALRELVVHDPGAVKDFLEEYEKILPALVKREVKNKLNSGLKNPRRFRR